MELNMILASMGIEAIDKNLQNIISEMSKLNVDSLTSEIQGWAKTIGLCIALGIGSFECYMMMLGKRGMDVMKILHIIIISICITSATWICEAAAAPGIELGDMAKNKAQEKNALIDQKLYELSKAQGKYFAALDSIIENAQVEEKVEKSWYEKLGESALGAIMGGPAGAVVGATDIAGPLLDNIKFRIRKVQIVIETKVCEWLGMAARFVAEVLFQVSYYGMLIAACVFMQILAAFCPILFAISLAPPFKSAWSQWLSKYISLSLWPFVVYMILIYVFHIMQYNIETDIEKYADLIPQNGGIELKDVATAGMQGLGSTCMYVVGLLVGVYLIKFVPEVASWLIPGGVSSGAGSGMAGGAMAVAGMAGGAAVAAVKGSAQLTGASASKAGQIGSAAMK